MVTAKRLFSVTNVACMRGGRMLFQKLSFGLNPGDVAHLSGPNGAGKTSLLRILCGALPAASGKVEWEGHNFLEKGMAEHGRRFSFLPADDRSLKPLETTLENLKFWAALWDLSESSCIRALEKMHIVHLKDKPVKALSSGQKRRLGIARAMLRKVPLWLFDEPLNGLDRESYDLFVAELTRHCAEGGMAAIASHYTIEPPKRGNFYRVDVGVG